MATCTYNCLMDVINIGNSIIGVSILAMPYCFSKCGIILSFVLIIVSGILTKLACYLLLKSAVRSRRRSFELLAFHTFGTYGKIAVEMSVIGFLIGVCIAFFVVIGDLGPPLAVKFLSFQNSPTLRTNLLVLVGFCVALPLGLLRKIDSLTSLSALSIAFYICLILKIFAEAVPNLAENEWWYGVNWWRSEGILPCLPIFALALSCQTQIFEFFDTSNDPSVKRMESVISGAVCLCSVVYIMVGSFGYIAFYNKNISGNVLVLLTPSVITEFIKLGFILTVAVSFPLCLFPCRSSLHSLLFKQGFVHHDINTGSIPDHRFRILTVSLVIITIGIAIMLPNIEFVLSIIGSTIGTLICLILPAMIFIYDSNKMSSERRKAQTLFSIGIFILVACTFSTLQENSSHQQTQSKVPNVLQMTPVLYTISSSLTPEIESPKIILKTKVDDQKKEQEKFLDTKAADSQKRLEPPVPQEPEIKNDQNADLDPQALQKEDKELQKDASLNPAKPAEKIKKDERLEKQEQLLKQLEEQQVEHKRILEEQKQVLEELKHHKESHEELRQKETNKKSEVNLVTSSVNQNIIDAKNSAKITESVKRASNIEFIPLVKVDNKPKNEESQARNDMPISMKNISKNIPMYKINQNVDDAELKDKLKNTDVNLAAQKHILMQSKFNETLDIPAKHKPQIANQNISILSEVETKVANNIPLKKNNNVDNVKVNIPKKEENDVKLGVHVKHRETLEEKVDETVSSPKDVIELVNNEIKANI